MIDLADARSPIGNHAGPKVAGSDRVGSPVDDLLTSPEELSKRRLAAELATELSSRLPFSRVSGESGDRGIDHTLRIVTASTSQIQQWYRELKVFISAIARGGIEIRGAEMTSELRTELAADIETLMVENVRHPLPSRSFVDFKYADLSPAQAWTEGQRRLEDACLRLANDALALFDSLQHGNLIGQIEEGSTTCRFTYFRRVAVAEPSGTRTGERVAEKLNQRNFQHGHIVEILQISDYEIQHRQAQHVHHVRQPKMNELGSTIHPLPLKYNDLVEECPDWLCGQLRILEGELFRHECIEWDLFTETRIAEKVTERVRRDPAVLIGPYVLAGWGEDAIKVEENRQFEIQNAVARKKAASAARINHVLSYATAALAILVVAMSASAIGTLTSLGIVLGLVAMGLAGKAAHLTSVAKGEVAAKPVMLHSTLVGTTAFAIQGLVFSILHWSLPAFIIGAIAAIVAAIAFNANRANTELDKSSVG